MEEEISVMRDRKVWHLVELPSGKSVLGNRWVYSIKKDEFGRIVRYKARLVAQGYRQVKGDSYDETYSPVIDFTVVRFFFSFLVSNLKWSNIQCDVKAAYLYAPLKEEIYMKQPLGFVTKGQENLVCRLDRAIYGLHQSGRMWYFELDSILVNLGFEKFQYVACAYRYKDFIVLLVYVDDIVVFGRTSVQAKNIVDMLNQHLDLKILGKTQKLLGVSFEYTNNSVLIHQKPYINEVYDRFSNFHIPSSSIPIVKGLKYSKLDCPSDHKSEIEMSKIPYRNLLGCLSFIASRTRPDITYSINIFSQFQSNPGLVHWSGLLKVLGYIKQTENLKLKLESHNLDLIAYSDADFASNRDDCISLGGSLIFLDKSPISWRTFKERGVSLSTMESEYIAMVDCVRELVWLNRIMMDCYSFEFIKVKPFLPIMYADNQSAIEFTKSPIENRRTKHINVKYHFIRKWFYEGVFNLKYIPSKLNLADPFTKGLVKSDLQKFVDKLFICV